MKILSWNYKMAAVFLKSIRSHFDKGEKEFPFNIRAYRNGIDITINSPFLIFVWENGSGKSTLLEAIADQCGFNLHGWNFNHHYGKERISELSKKISLSWFPKIKTGFYLRAENLMGFSDYIDDLATSDPWILDIYGGKSLKNKSHWEALFSLLQGQMKNGIYLLDEPETALSPKRQIELLALMRHLSTTQKIQFIMVTHSPIIMSVPDGQVIQFEKHWLTEIPYTDTLHFQMTKLFLDCPNRFHQ